MAYALCESVHFCISNHRVALLDVANDRYLALPPAQDEAFQRLSAGGALSLADRDVLRPLTQSGILHEFDGTPAFRAPVACPPRPYSGTLPPPNTVDILVALSIRLLTHRQLKAAPLSLTLARLTQSKQAIQQLRRPTDRQVSSAVAALRATTRWLPVKDQCLSWSVASTRFLHQHHIAADTIIGVRMRPFAAHAWVQWQGQVLNDETDEVAPYTPILVV